MSHRVFVVAAMIAVLAAAEPKPGSAAPDCFQFANCSACTEAPSGRCGWDPSAFECKEGSAAGPTSTEGWSGNWWWTEGQCCSSNSGCSTCASSSFCGWDANLQRCLQGSAYGPAIGWSTAWVYDYSACPTQCQQHSDCDSCTAHTGCGWIEEQAMCASGSSNGPYQNQGKLRLPFSVVESSHWYVSSCPWSWRLSLRAKSYSLWCIVGACVAALVLLGIRRRCSRSRPNGGAFPTPTCPLKPSMSSPLMMVGPSGEAATLGTQYYGAAPESAENAKLCLP